MIQQTYKEVRQQHKKNEFHKTETALKMITLSNKWNLLPSTARVCK